MTGSPVILTEMVPHTLSEWDIATDVGRDAVRAWYARGDAAYVRLNMITSLTGSAAGSDGTSDTLTSRIDRTILQVIRRDADVVVVGAASVRAEGFAVPAATRLAVVTSSGDLAGHRLTLPPGAAADQVMILCPAGRASEIASRVRAQRMQIVPVPGPDRMSPRGIVEALADRGHRRVVCEGGPDLASQFAAAGVIDEYCVTVAPVIEPVERSFLRVTDSDRPDTEVSGLLVDEAGFSYLRLRARR